MHNRFHLPCFLKILPLGDIASSSMLGAGPKKNSRTGISARITPLPLNTWSQSSAWDSLGLFLSSHSLTACTWEHQVVCIANHAALGRSDSPAGCDGLAVGDTSDIITSTLAGSLIRRSLGSCLQSQTQFCSASSSVIPVYTGEPCGNSDSVASLAFCTASVDGVI